MGRQRLMSTLLARLICQWSQLSTSRSFFFPRFCEGKLKHFKRYPDRSRGLDSGDCLGHKWHQNLPCEAPWKSRRASLRDLSKLTLNAHLVSCSDASSMARKWLLSEALEWNQEWSEAVWLGGQRQVSLTQKMQLSSSWPMTLGQVFNLLYS